MSLCLCSERIEFRESFELIGLLALEIGTVISQPFQSLPDCAATFKKIGTSEIRLGIETMNEEFGRNLIQFIEFEASAFGDKCYWDQIFCDPKCEDSDDDDAFSSRWILCIIDDIVETTDSLDIHLEIRLDNSQNQVKHIFNYLDSHPNTIGHLAKEDLEKFKLLCQTEMKFYSDANGNELIQTALVDLHAMAHRSKYIRGLLRFKQHTDGDLAAQVPSKSEKLICEHFNEETIADLIAFTHGRKFKRSYFAEKPVEYLIRMGYICNQLLIEPLQLMIDDCLFLKIRKVHKQERHMESLTKSLKYAVETSRFTLLKKLWQSVFRLKLEPDSKEYLLIRQALKEAGGEILAVIADSTKSLITHQSSYS